jgi:hypothetical protein
MKAGETRGPTFMPGIEGASMWSALSIGARMGHEEFYNAFADSPSFAPDTRIAWFIHLADMAEALEWLRGGGNWETQRATALFNFAVKYPELKKSRAWMEQGWSTAQENLMETVHPDGPLRESSLNYHNLCMGRFAGMIEKARSLGMAVPPAFEERVERMYDFVMFATLPDGSLPIWGDTNPSFGSGLLARGADLFKPRREDLRWVATGGKEGTPPVETSKFFPHGGYAVMRDRWGPEGHVLALHNGRFSGHGHHDNLSIVVSAFGKNILIDPGIYTYGTPQAAELTRTRSHNTITVDGRDCLNADGVNAFATGPGMDVFDGTNAGYDGLEGVKHRRRIVFVKGDEALKLPAYWVVVDDVTGEGEHEVAAYYHFNPDASLDRPGMMSNRVFARMGDTTLGLLLEQEQPKAEIGTAITAAGWERFVDAPLLKYARRGTLPFHSSTVLIPGYGRTPETVGSFPNLAEEDGGIGVSYVGGEDFILWGGGAGRRAAIGRAECRPGGMRLLVKQFECQADAALLRYGTAPVRLTWVGGKAASGRAARVLATSDFPLDWLDVCWFGDLMSVTARGDAKGLKVATFGAKRWTYNGGPEREIPEGATVVAP